MCCSLLHFYVLFTTSIFDGDGGAKEEGGRGELVMRIRCILFTGFEP